MTTHLSDEQLNGYIHCTLTNARREAMDIHLATCPACKARLGVFERARHQIRDGLDATLRAAYPSTRVQFSGIARRLRRARRWGMLKTQTIRLATTAALLIAVVALALTLSSLLGGQGKPSEPRETVTITFACRNYQRDWYQQLADKFHHMHPSITVQLVSADEILEQTVSGGVGTVSSDEACKLARASDTFIESSLMMGVSPQDVALNVADLAAHEGGFDLGDFYPGPLVLFQDGDKLWGLPFEADSLFVFYRPDLLDQAGVSYPQIGWTWDDLLEKADRLTVREGGMVKRYGFVDPWFGYTLSALAHQKAGSLLKDEHGFLEARLDDPTVSAAVQWYADLILTYGVMLDPTTEDRAMLQVLAHDQPLPMWVGLSSEWDNFADKIGVVPFPEAGEGAMPISAQGYLISAGTVHPEAAWRWIAFLSQQSPYRYASGVPARKSVVDSAHYWNRMSPETAAAFRYCLEHAIDYPGAIRRELGRAFEAMLQRQAPQERLAALQDALSEGQVRVNQELADAAAASRRAPTPIAVSAPLPTPVPGGTQVRFRVLYDADLPVYRTLAERFQQDHPDIAVQVELGSSWLPAVLASESGCFLSYPSGITRTTSDLLALDPLVAEDGAFDLSAYDPAFLRQVQAGGMLWGLPLETDAQLLYYNRALFDRAHIPCPTVDWTPYQLVESAIALAGGAGADSAGLSEAIYGFFPRDGAFADVPGYVAWLGGRLFDASGRPTFDDPTVIEALASYADLIATAGPPPAQERSVDRWAWTVTSTRGTHPGQAGTGRVAMWVDLYSNHRDAPPLGFEAGVVPLPAGAAPIGSTSSRALFISAQTDIPDACWTWIAFLSAQPDAVRQLPVRRNLALDSAWRQQAGGETADAWASVLSRGEQQPPSWESNPVSYQALYWLDEALVDVLSGMSPSDALIQAQVRASAFVTCMQESGGAEGAWRGCAQEADPAVVLPPE